MSKERELLKRVVEYMWVGDIVEEIKELLAQPEQTEQEPVAWMNDSGGCFLSDGTKYSENWTALYTSPPPKRKPLSEEEIAFIWSDPDYQTEEDVTRAIEKMHNIGLDDWRWGNE